MKPPAPATLLITFNRPETTKKVLEAISLVEPTRLYVFSDGPRHGNPADRDRIGKVRNLISQNNWPGEIFTNYLDENMGCGPGVKFAIDWFFTHEPEGVILEDDTVPDSTFFRFCGELLERYRDDCRVGMVAGTNYVRTGHFESSYHFSKNRETWGWATWRRAWEVMDLEMTWQMSPQASDVLSNSGVTQWRFRKWERAMDDIKSERVSAWDFQWALSLAANNMLCIFPKENLVANIGFGPDATHTKGMSDERYQIVGRLSFPLVHPRYVLQDHDFDRKFEAENFRPRAIAELKRSLARMIPVPIRTQLFSTTRRFRRFYLQCRREGM